MRRKKPTVSVLVPIYNGADYLDECIESVLNQTYSDFELILVDDGSTDGSYDIASRYATQDDRILLLAHERNCGLVDALNLGLEVASGQLIARLGHDDVALPHRLEEQVAFMERRSEIVVLGSSMFLIASDGKTEARVICPETDSQIRFGLLFNNKIADPSVVYRAQVAVKHRVHYDRSYCAAEDYAFWAVMLRYGQAYSIREPLVKYRTHEKQTSLLRASEQECSAERISTRLLYDLNPSFSFGWAERKVLDFLYLVYLSAHMSGSPIDRTGLLQRLEKIKIVAEAEAQQKVKAFEPLNALQAIAHQFISQTGSIDEAVQGLTSMN